MQTTSGNSTDIAIIGGGMVGAALAALLAAACDAWQITLIETFPLPAADTPLHQPSFDARSTAIAAGSAELLQQAGVWAALQLHATAIRQVHVSERGHAGGTVIDRRDLRAEALGYVIPNAWIGNVLLCHLQTCPNVRLLAPAQVRQLQPLAGGTRLRIAAAAGAETHIDCQLAVIADGAQSPLRQALGIATDVFDYGQTAIIANVAFDLPHRGIAYERFTEQGPLALLPLGERDQARECALVWTHPRAAADAVLALDDSAFLQALQARVGYRLGQCVRVGRRDSYPLQRILACEQVRSGIAVMGNAAHFLHPVAGQGFNLALRDCAALAQQLARARAAGQGLGQLAVLQAYVQQQARDQQLTVGGSDLLTRLFSNASLPLAALRALGFIGLELVPAAKHWLSLQSMGQGGRKIDLHTAAGHRHE